MEVPITVDLGNDLGTFSKLWDLGKQRRFTWQCTDLPSGYVKIAIENDPVEIVDFPINSMVDLSSSLC